MYARDQEALYQPLRNGRPVPSVLSRLVTRPELPNANLVHLDIPKAQAVAEPREQNARHHAARASVSRQPAQTRRHAAVPPCAPKFPVERGPMRSGPRRIV